jgi:hypothetical protein
VWECSRPLDPLAQVVVQGLDGIGGIDHLADCRRERAETVNKRYLCQHGPVRDGARLDGAIAEPQELGRLRLQKEGQQIDVVVNPALLPA